MSGSEDFSKSAEGFSIPAEDFSAIMEARVLLSAAFPAVVLAALMLATGAVIFFPWLVVGVGGPLSSAEGGLMSPGLLTLLPSPSSSTSKSISSERGYLKQRHHPC